MNFITINKQNIEQEHLCCAMTDKNAKEAKKLWLLEIMQDGYTMTKLDDRGKVFIEYVAAEHAWCPIHAPEYLFIDCFWVSGKFVKKGIGTALLTMAIEAAQAQGKQGLCAVTASKKDHSYLTQSFTKRKGF